tara:strand:+ start:194 stop:316 length:123 start_codon:yes stop_codon:yes gene_type:complete
MSKYDDLQEYAKDFSAQLERDRLLKRDKIIENALKDKTNE